MRQASWNEMFTPRREQAVFSPEVPVAPTGWRRLLWWEDVLTFALLAIMMLAVTVSVQTADWVDGMPSLLPTALLGLLMGTTLARIRWPEGFVHLLALPAGAAAALGMIISVLPGPTPWDRYNELQARMHDWFRVAFTGGISNDDLPFIVLVVSLSWLAAYAAAWAIFRWRNVWLALVPGGALLLMNISYQPGQFSFAFVIFLIGAVLLVTRLHLMERTQLWRDDGTPYPPFLSLSVLHATFWLALLLVGIAWFLPLASEARPLESLWQRTTAPVSERSGELGRLFIGVNSEKAGRVHNFNDILPFLGSIELPDRLALEVSTEALEGQAFLRAQVYDIYTSTGWRRRSQENTSLVPNVTTGVDDDLQARIPITIRIVSSGRTGDTIFTVGQPRQIDIPATFEWARVRADVTSVEARRRFGAGEAYQSVGSISVATDDELRAAGLDFPRWVELDYLQLPEDFPQSVGALASELTASEPTLYDKTVSVESYLRTIPYDLNVQDAPRDRDAIEYFLFEAQRGYFDYHASAMVVMLRSLGIPSRLAVGYALREDQKSPVANVYSVTERAAFAWPEVYFPGFGWVEFNPTPGLPTISRGSTTPGSETSSDDRTVPSAGLGFEHLEEQFADLGGGEQEFVVASSDTNYGRWILISLVILVPVAIASGGTGLTFAWLRGLRGLDLPARRWGQTVRLASWARMPPASSDTPTEYARELRERMPDLDSIELLGDAYVRHRYGQAQLDEAGSERIETAWRTVRRGLLAKLLRVPWR